MSQREFLYGSVAGDRVYDPLSFPRVWARLASNGVVTGFGSSLAVVENSPPAQNVKVGLGAAFVMGHYFEVYGAPEVLAVGAAHATLARIDRVIIRRSLAARTTALAILPGVAAASPAAPALTQNEAGVYEISLAQILVPAASSSVITSRITDERSYATAQIGSLLDPAVGHKHDGATGGRKVSFLDLTSIPGSFTPAAHSHDHGTNTDLGANDHPQYVLEALRNVQDGFAGLDNDASARIPAARLGTGTSDATTYLGGDRTWKVAAAVVHDHAAGAGGNVPYANVSGKPASFVPSAHAASHKTGGSDVMKASEIQGFDRYATVGTAGQKIFIGATTPTSPAPAEGDIWFKA